MVFEEMTELELEKIEAAIGFALPAEYRRVAIEFPFRRIGLDWIYWFYNDAGRVIDGTLAPLGDGEYDMTDWRPGYVTIGESASGDLYVMDTTVASLPVHCLSHETHRIDPEYATFAGFVEDWIDAPEKVAATLAATKAVERAEQRVRNLRALVFVLCAIPCSVLFAIIVSWIALWLKG